MATTGSSFSASTSAAAAAGAERAPDDAACDVVVGFPAVDAAGAAAGIAAAREALATDTGERRWRVILARPAAEPEGAAPAAADANVAEVSYVTHASDALVVPFHGMQARARALHAIIREARACNARACVVADPRAPLSAHWIATLAHPLLEDAADLIEPVYRRHPFHGGLVNGIVYPLFRALYGAAVRYPLGGDFACSRACIETVADDPYWETDQAQIGVDWWLSATAVSQKLRVAEAWLGDKVDERTGLDLSATMAQVLGVCFSDMERRAALWHRVRQARPVPRYGTPASAPEPPDVDVTALADAFRLGTHELEDVWAEVLPPLAILQWRRLALGAGVPRVDDSLWARTVYDFAMGYRLRVIARDHLLASLAPLYLGWLASFIAEMRPQPPEAAESRIERLGQAFVAEKPYLVSQWRWPERFRPMKARR